MNARALACGLIGLLAGCAAAPYAPHVADAGVSGALLSTGQFVELNPLGFPGAVAAKVLAESVAVSYRDAGDPYTCTQVAYWARAGSSVGLGASIGALAGPFGLVAGGLIGLFALDRPNVRSAVETCYSRRSAPSVAGGPTGWNG